MALENTHFGAEGIAALLDGPKRIFFAGIGGISMCSLAWISRLRGHTVTGYDRTPSPITRALAADGITVHYDADPSHVDGVDLLVYTVAMPASNPEIAEARRRGIPCVSRADFLGYVMTSYRQRIGVCGMHGKSTTTSMLERIFAEAGRDPVVTCGATMKDVGAPYRIGKGSDFVFEACEYMDSFLDFQPTMAVILNIEMDHVDYFHSMEQITDSFGAFMDRTGKDGFAVVNRGDGDVMTAARNYEGHLVTFGVECDSAVFNATDITFRNACPSFVLRMHGEPLGTVTMAVPGAHIVCDATAAAAAALTCGVPFGDVVRGLASFHGAERRMDFCGKTAAGADVYTDYAHHPTEIRATLATVSRMNFRRVFCVFQPHTFSRTYELFGGFADALASAKLHRVLLAEIYPARETNQWGVTSGQLADAVASHGQACASFDTFDGIRDYLLHNAGTGDMVLVMGAGDINNIVKQLLP